MNSYVILPSVNNEELDIIANLWTGNAGGNPSMTNTGLQGTGSSTLLDPSQQRNIQYHLMQEQQIPTLVLTLSATVGAPRFAPTVLDQPFFWVKLHVVVCKEIDETFAQIARQRSRHIFARSASYLF